MARPKGSTLSALFEVSEQERQAFYERIQKTIHPVSDVPILESGTPVKGIPETGTPATGVPFSGAPHSRIRRATLVQDGHSFGEQALYDALDLQRFRSP